MAAQAAAKALKDNGDPLKPISTSQQQRSRDLSTSLRTWREVLIGELLNLLEKRRYDACN
jgi:hypothetical protein